MACNRVAVEASLPQRTVARVFQLLSSNVVNDLLLLESLMDSMTARQRDSSTVVRMLALRGLGNVASGSPEKVRVPVVVWPREVSQAVAFPARLLSLSPSLRAPGFAMCLEMRSLAEVHWHFPGQKNGCSSSSARGPESVCYQLPALAASSLLLQESRDPLPEQAPRGLLLLPSRGLTGRLLPKQDAQGTPVSGQSISPPQSTCSATELVV